MRLQCGAVIHDERSNYIDMKKSFPVIAYAAPALPAFLLPTLLWPFVLLLLTAPALSVAGQAREKPNIILIMADDLGYGDLGCYGQEMIRTPCLDSLASSGIKFTAYYAGSTVCAPSREALLTGMHTGHTFIKGNFNTGDPEGDLSIPAVKITIAEYLEKAGYRTAVIGKWGLGSPGSGPNTQGFDYSFSYLDQISAHNYYPPHLYENEEKILLEGNSDGSETTYSHDLFAEKTLEYIRNEGGKQPFFLYLPYTIPHGKHVIPSDAPYSNEDWPQNMKNYAAMINRLDRDIGRIAQLLKEKDMSDNTILLFTSDNGANAAFAKFFRSNGPLRGAKRDLYEGGIREPLIVSWPGKIAAGGESDHVTAAWDILPTLCEIAGAPAPAATDGISFVPELLGKQQAKHEFLYWEYYAYNWNWGKKGNHQPRNWLESQAVRFGKWKAVKTNLLEEPGTGIELFDLEADPGEERDVSADHRDEVRKAAGYFSVSSAKSLYYPYKDSLYIIAADNPRELKDFFHYTDKRIPFISAHRGGAAPGFPENCLATFENTLRHIPAILEVDPRYTKDSVIVLMHDPTLDRTTNGTGKVADHTWEELKELRLKDPEGSLTDYRIPTLAEALKWAKGKTVLILDQKDVPVAARVRAIEEQDAGASAMLIVYSYEEASECYALNKDLMMEVMVPDAEKATAFERTGVPWENIIAFVGHKKPQDKSIYELIHGKGTMCVVGSSRIYDKEFLAGDKQAYEKLIAEGADIIEADLAIPAGEAIKSLAPRNSPKSVWFRRQPHRAKPARKKNGRSGN